MRAQFISDLHLDASRPDATRAFLAFLAGPAREADALFILGDLFEAWVGDDATDDHARDVARALADFTATGRRCGFVAGNRDFLLGPAFARRAGLELLAEESQATVAGQPALLMHGDTLCTADLAYQRYRRVVHQRAVQAAFLALPVAIRRAVARRLRARSGAASSTKPDHIMDVDGDAVRAAIDRHGVRLLIHGHTHRPGVHAVAGTAGPARRVVLGAWHTAGSVLRFAGGEPELVSLPFG
jgi:UDP-2,3-diacylglucosamine hydrolase